MRSSIEKYLGRTGEGKGPVVQPGTIETKFLPASHCRKLQLKRVKYSVTSDTSSAVEFVVVPMSGGYLKSVIKIYKYLQMAEGCCS
jgi:hypothetical protein